MLVSINTRCERILYERLRTRVAMADWKCNGSSSRTVRRP